MKKVYKYKDTILVAEYDSQTEAANDLNVSEFTIRNAIKYNLTNKGFRFTNILEPQSTLNNPIALEAKTNSNKVLLLDIETSASIAYTFNVWNVNIRPEQIIEDWYILCFSAKWLGSDKVISNNIEEDEDDFNVVSELWNLLDEAEVVVTHNIKFDINKINTRFLIHGLTPPSPYKTFDTLTSARKNFGFTYNKLDYLSKQLGSDGKLTTDFSLWIKCMDRDIDSLNIMQGYCDNDVLELEKLYLKLRPFDNSHPNMNIFSNEESCCTKCGSTNLEYIKDTFTNTRVFKLFKCKDCKGWSRSRKSENKLNVLISK